MQQHNNGASDLNQQLKDTPNPVFEAELFSGIKAETEVYLNHFDKLSEGELFPAEVFPSPFLQVITETRKTLNFPTDYMGLAILVAIATAVGKSAMIRVKKGWYEFSSLYAALIGKPGANKSHPIEAAFKPFQGMDREQIKKFQREYDEFEEFQALNKKDKGNMPKPESPKLIKTVLHNFTPEILHQRLTDNDRGCAIVSEELATFLDGMNNYSKGDQASVYLSFWSNKPTSIDRVSKPVPLWLPQPFLNIIGSIQPRVLPKLFPINKTDNGFLQRFLFAFPDNVEKQPINDFEIEENVLSNYSKWINEYRQSSPIVIDPETELPKAKIYEWSKEAKEFFYEWSRENTTLVNNNNDSLVGEIMSKFDIHFCRLSLVLQVMEDYNSYEISLNAAKGAAKLCAYFLRSGLKVLEVLGNQSKADELPQDKKQLFEILPDEFTTGEGLLIAESLGVPERTFKDFLKDRKLFRWLKHGNYKKQK